MRPLHLALSRVADTTTSLHPESKSITTTANVSRGRAPAKNSKSADNARTDALRNGASWCAIWIPVVQKPTHQDSRTQGGVLLASSTNYALSNHPSFLIRVDTAYHNVTAMVGAGVLNLPATFAVLGWAGGMIALIASLGISWFTFGILVILHEVR